MRNTFGILVLSALTGFAGVAYAQTPDGQVPANEHVCDGLKADGITKALYGLCVAFCEAQDCVATYDPATSEAFFDPSCQPSNPKILDTYNRLKAPSEPSMPCVNIVADGCPCWTAADLDIFREHNFTGGSYCQPLNDIIGSLYMLGWDAEWSQAWWASTTYFPPGPGQVGTGADCYSYGPGFIRYQVIWPSQYQTCRELMITAGAEGGMCPAWQ